MASVSVGGDYGPQRGGEPAVAGLPHSVVSSSSQSSPLLFVDSFPGVDGTGVSDSSTGFQNALATASARGAITGEKYLLRGTPGAKYKLSEVTPLSYVDLDLSGCLLVRNSTYAADHSLFYDVPSISGSPITDFALRGGRLIGTGGETPNQGLVRVEQSTFITVVDWHISNVAASIIWLSDSQWMWINRNKMFTVCQAGFGNAINFVNRASGVTVPLKYIFCDQNYIDGCPTIPINVVSPTEAARTDPVVDAHITNNTAISTGGGWCIGVEQGGSAGGGPPNMGVFDISGNTCIQNGPGLYAMVLENDSTPRSNDPLCIYDATVRGNRLIANGAGAGGLLCKASRSSITGNVIEANLHDINLIGHGTAVLNRLTIVGNSGHLGSGQEVNVTAGQVDTTTLTISNTP